MTEQNPTPTNDAAKKPTRGNRITLIIIIAMVALWALAMLFRNPIRANFWAWRLAHNPDDETRGRLVQSLIALGDSARGPAIGLTRSDDVAVRLAGQDVLLGLIDRQQRDRAARLKDYIARNPGGIESLPDELRQPLSIDPTVVARFREMLDDPAPAAQANAIQLAMIARDRESLGQLEKLAIAADDAEVALAATGALGRLSGGSAEASLHRILSQAREPSARAQAIELLGEPGDDAPWAYRTHETVTGLAEALDDEQVVVSPPMSVRFNQAIRKQVQQYFLDRGMTSQPDSQPAVPEPITVADFAARMLGAMIDQPTEMLSGKPPAEREKLIATYRAWASKASF